MTEARSPGPRPDPPQDQGGQVKSSRAQPVQPRPAFDRMHGPRPRRRKGATAGGGRDAVCDQACSVELLMERRILGLAYSQSRRGLRSGFTARAAAGPGRRAAAGPGRRRDADVRVRASVSG